MKNLWIALLTLLATPALLALPLGNPWEASLYTDGVWIAGNCPSYWETSSQWGDAWNVRIGYYGDFVHDRRMQVDRKEDRASIRSTHINTQAVYGVVNFWQRFDLFGTLGETFVKIATPQHAFIGQAVNNYIEINTETDFSWSLGVRGTLWECGCLGIGAEAQYFAARPSINSIYSSLSGVTDINYPPKNVHLKYADWQIGFGASYRVNIICEGTALIPYSGLKFGRAVLKSDNYTTPFDQTIFNLESDRTWGYVFGITLLGCNKISLAAEARFNDETALYVNSQFRF